MPTLLAINQLALHSCFEDFTTNQKLACAYCARVRKVLCLLGNACSDLQPGFQNLRSNFFFLNNMPKLK